MYIGIHAYRSSSCTSFLWNRCPLYQFVGEDASCALSSSWIAYLTSLQLQFPSLNFCSSFLAKLFFTEHFHDYLNYFTISYWPIVQYIRSNFAVLRGTSQTYCATSPILAIIFSFLHFCFFLILLQNSLLTCVFSAQTSLSNTALAEKRE